jgi:cytochrome c-type biogenesis protein CcmF
VFARIADAPAAQRDPLLAQALDGLARSYARNPPPATFRMITSPLVSWIWIGALTVFAGALICLWPTRPSAQRPAVAAYKARVARELTRA